MIKTLKNIFLHISKKRKNQFLLLLFITIVVSLFEMLSIASVVPFIKATTDENFLEEKYLILKFITISNKEEAIIITGLIFAFFIFINSILRCILIYISTKLANIVTAELSIKIYTASLFETYSEHISKQTGNIISAVTQKVYQTYYLHN